MKNSYAALSIVATAAALVACAQLSGAERTPMGPEIINVSMTIDGKSTQVVTYVYRPEAHGRTAVPVVIYAHGNRVPPSALVDPITPDVANWWRRKGFAVVAPVRPGYGPKGGQFREAQNVRWEGSACTSRPTYESATLKGSEVVGGALEWVQGQAWAKRDRVILVGYSAGWPGTLAKAATNPNGVVAAINFSGGMGGNPVSSPGRSCEPELLTDMYRRYGATARIPTLWIYARNDLFWGADQPKDWFEAYKAGGSDTGFIQTAPAGANGHFLIDTAGPLWQSAVEAFLQKVKM